MSAADTLIYNEVDLDQDGKQSGFLRLPHSVHRSAYGWIPIPIVMIKQGTGPTVLLMAGNHGDEYEGQVALSKLCRSLEPSRINGRIIILPMANYPAALAGMRTSPIDQGNLNRSFPGNAKGTPTEMIAHFIEEILLPQCDYFFDFHSGGSSLRYPPTSMRGRGSNAQDEAKLQALQVAFDAPYGFVFSGEVDERVAGCAALRKNVLSMSTELGGAGTVDPAILAIAERGINRLLHHIGVLPDYAPDAAQGSRLMETRGRAYYVFARDDGLFEPKVSLLDDVHKGQAAGAIHHPETPWVAPSPCQFDESGMVMCVRVPGRVQRGDCLFHLATDI